VTHSMVGGGGVVVWGWIGRGGVGGWRVWRW